MDTPLSDQVLAWGLHQCRCRLLCAPKLTPKPDCGCSAGNLKLRGRPAGGVQLAAADRQGEVVGTWSYLAPEQRTQARRSCMGCYTVLTFGVLNYNLYSNCLCATIHVQGLSLSRNPASQRTVLFPCSFDCRLPRFRAVAPRGGMCTPLD
jgi:hypothetical protein